VHRHRRPTPAGSGDGASGIVTQMAYTDTSKLPLVWVFRETTTVQVLLECVGYDACISTSVTLAPPPLIANSPSSHEALAETATFVAR
jgi:hypothetical protein